MSVLRNRDVLASIMLWLSVAGGVASRGSNVIPGVDVFLAGYTYLVKDQKVGLITNQTGINRHGESTIDLLYRHPDVNLTALFAPEHGIRGLQSAGEHVAETRDGKTGLPVYSLYGGNDKRPAKVVVERIDALIYDIQDVGSRAYTYIWSMAEAMAAAGEHQKSFIVLDRPNPLGCRRLDGPLAENAWLSFIGLYPIPRVYGMTCGELARYLNREHNLQCRLIVIPVAGYNRSLSWHETGLPWVPPSPNIPTPESAACFAATGTIGVLGVVHIGIGTRIPFQMFGAPWIDAAHAADHLNSIKLPGVSFVPFTFTPRIGLFKNREVQAVRLKLSDPVRFQPSTTEIMILCYLRHYYHNQMEWDREKYESFDKAMGTSRVREDILNGREPSHILRSWQKDLSTFRAKTKPYLIYR